MNGGTIGIDSERFAGQVDIDSSGDGVCDDEHGGCQVVRLDLRMYSSFEVPIAAQNGNRNQVPVVNFCSHFRRQRPRVADACCASVSDGLESELFQRLG